jgi:hypothetical protein
MKVTRRFLLQMFVIVGGIIGIAALNSGVPTAQACTTQQARACGLANRQCISNCIKTMGGPDCLDGCLADYGQCLTTCGG